VPSVACLIAVAKTLLDFSFSKVEFSAWRNKIHCSWNFDWKVNFCHSVEKKARNQLFRSVCFPNTLPNQPTRHNKGTSTCGPPQSSTNFKQPQFSSIIDSKNLPIQNLCYSSSSSFCSNRYYSSYYQNRLRNYPSNKVLEMTAQSPQEQYLRFFFRKDRMVEKEMTVRVSATATNEARYDWFGIIEAD
jgi:hypothetical protein